MVSKLEKYLLPIHLEDLKTGNIEDADEGSPLPLRPVQRAVDPHHDPLEQALVQRFADRLHCELALQTQVFFFIKKMYSECFSEMESE